MDSKTIARINELAHKSKSVGLTDAEKAEQAKLRAEYIAAIRANIKSSLDNVTMVNADGSHSSLKEEHEKRMAERASAGNLDNTRSDEKDKCSSSFNSKLNDAVAKDVESKDAESKDTKSDSEEAPENEPDRQFYFMEKCSEWLKKKEAQLGRKLTFHTSTFGCQMNFKDSEKLGGVLTKIGFVEEETETADFVIYNTCTVRENANTRVYGRLGYVGKIKKKNPEMMLAMCGCMMQEPHVVEKIKTSYSFVDIIFGTHNIYKLAELIYEFLRSNDRLNIEQENSTKVIANGKVISVLDAKNEQLKKDIISGKIVRLKDEKPKKKKHRMIIDIWKDTDKIVEELPSNLKASFKAGVNIMYGCNNFCSYCIVPYVRGRERSRKPEDIIKEIKNFVANGVKEVMLLGQNVNSYGKNLENPISFAELLKQVDEVEGLERVRFMTSHPKDLSDELIEVMKNAKKVCKHIHLPVQSGSSRLLKLMNRHYTKEDYLLLIDKLKKAIPDIAITTDIIVGFPGETEEDFEDTLDICRKVRYSSAFTFIYSKRSGTPAAAMENQVPEDLVKERFDRLLAVVNECSAEFAQQLTGQVLPVLVEERDRENEENKNYLTGRLDNNLLVHFEGEDELIGKIINVKLDECKGFYYIGSIDR